MQDFMRLMGMKMESCSQHRKTINKWQPYWNDRRHTNQNPRMKDLTLSLLLNVEKTKREVILHYHVILA